MHLVVYPVRGGGEVSTGLCDNRFGMAYSLCISELRSYNMLGEEGGVWLYHRERI